MSRTEQLATARELITTGVPKAQVARQLGIGPFTDEHG